MSPFKYMPWIRQKMKATYELNKFTNKYNLNEKTKKGENHATSRVDK